MTKKVRKHTGATAAPALSIAAVERDSGISKDTLRAWERRYGFPAPQRDAFDERVYPLDQVARLRAIKRLLDQGFRPSKIIRMPLDELRELAQPPGLGARAHPVRQPEQRAGLELIRAHRAQDLQQWLSRALPQRGLARFVFEIVAPLNEAVGDAWALGELQVFEEHLYSETIQLVLRNAIHDLPAAAGAPHIVLTTLPAEAHGLGLLMAHAVLALEGARVTSLGVQTPLLDIVGAARAHRAHVVALSFSSLQRGNAVVEPLAQLRAALPAAIEIWAGGRCPILHRKPIAGVVTLRELTDIGPALAAWRHAHSAR